MNHESYHTKNKFDAVWKSLELNDWRACGKMRENSMNYDSEMMERNWFFYRSTSRWMNAIVSIWWVEWIIGSCHLSQWNTRSVYEYGTAVTAIHVVVVNTSPNLLPTSLPLLQIQSTKSRQTGNSVRYILRVFGFFFMNHTTNKQFHQLHSSVNPEFVRQNRIISYATRNNYYQMMALNRYYEMVFRFGQNLGERQMFRRFMINE